MSEQSTNETVTSMRDFAKRIRMVECEGGEFTFVVHPYFARVLENACTRLLLSEAALDNANQLIVKQNEAINFWKGAVEQRIKDMQAAPPEAGITDMRLLDIAREAASNWTPFTRNHDPQFQQNLRDAFSSGYQHGYRAAQPVPVPPSKSATDDALIFRLNDAAREVIEQYEHRFGLITGGLFGPIDNAVIALRDAFAKMTIAALASQPAPVDNTEEIEKLRWALRQIVERCAAPVNEMAQREAVHYAYKVATVALLPRLAETKGDVRS